jgi:hypothetical protein
VRLHRHNDINTRDNFFVFDECAVYYGRMWDCELILGGAKSCQSVG